MYINKECIEKVGFFDENFVNIHEHVDYTYRIIKAGLHPPFWYFADIASAHNYIGDSTQFRDTTIPKTDEYYQRLKGADIYFSMKHEYTPTEIPKSTIEELLLFLLEKKPWHIIEIHYICDVNFLSLLYYYFLETVAWVGRERK